MLVLICTTGFIIATMWHWMALWILPYESYSDFYVTLYLCHGRCFRRLLMSFMQAVPMHIYIVIVHKLCKSFNIFRNWCCEYQDFPRTLHWMRNEPILTNPKSKKWHWLANDAQKPVFFESHISYPGHEQPWHGTTNDPHIKIIFFVYRCLH